MKPNTYEMAAFLKANLKDCGYLSYDVLLIANIIVDYLSLCGIRADEEEY